MLRKFQLFTSTCFLLSLTCVVSFETRIFESRSLHRVGSCTYLRSKTSDADKEGIHTSHLECSIPRRDVWTGLLGAVALTSLIPSAAATGDVLKPFQVSLQVQMREGQVGEIVIEVLPEWAPLAAKRFQGLLEAGFFENARFFRVLPGYIAQFGIAGDPELNKVWMFDKSKALPDEKRVMSNKKGTLSFASSGKNSRQTQLFINLVNNDGLPNFLDAQGFVPFARVIKGMEDVVPSLYSGYGVLEAASGGIAGSVNQGKAAYFGNKYMEALFPKLSFIRSARIL
jgi:cyclophilin family peptidyl-prolyl cis-trans isomerase